MDTLFVSSDSAPGPRPGASNEQHVHDMNRVPDPLSSSLMGAAANADRLGESDAAAATQRSAIDIEGLALEGRSIESRSIETSGGWNAYEVWRRLIKEVRDLRKRPDSN
jgi:hypothetical protein